ncbi:MAG: aspartate-semialdehyde dehydrogenase [Candidatus Eremiobacteraeota bacterium]|nr:aspartate-semialdehyde dehydrogenase [Candidatus Eremiobacteraeota bacterium]
MVRSGNVCRRTRRHARPWASGRTRCDSERSEGTAVDVAIVGATGAVGETIVRVLEERGVPVGRLTPFATSGRRNAVMFRGAALDVRATTAEALSPYDVVFFAGGEDASERYAPRLLERGCVVIDNSATFRLRDDVPLIVPEVNAGALRAGHRLFPVANCTAILLCAALAPIRETAGLRCVRVATYQAASGAGRAGLDELRAGERAVALGGDEPDPAAFVRPLARNVIPQVGAIDSSGFTSEENKIRDETRKMLDIADLPVSALAVRVPVRTAHSLAIFVQTLHATTVDALAAAFERAPGITYHRDGIVTPREVEGTDQVHVARLRTELGTASDEFALWCVGDQLRKGAATNAVQILELLLQRGYVRA